MPETFATLVSILMCYTLYDLFCLSVCFIIVSNDMKRHSGGYSVGVPPLPIPNREVKPDRADGTAFVGE